MAPRRRVRGQDPQGRQARRPPRGAAHEVRSGHQPQERQGAWPDDLAVLATAGGRDHPVNYTFNWSVLWTGQSGEWLLSGLLMTLKLSVVAWLLAVALGILSGALRTVALRLLRVLATFYVEFFRNVPLLVWMFFWYFAVPPALPDRPREWLNEHSLEFWAAVVALGVYSGARFSEVLRSGIQAIPKTQMEASIASGLTVFQAYRYVILPIALRLIIPPATSESLNRLK